MITKIKTALIKQGYEIDMTSDYIPPSIIRKFQHDHDDLMIDGIMGPKTMKAILEKRDHNNEQIRTL